jgi:hypothetical protein
MIAPGPHHPRWLQRTCTTPAASVDFTVPTFVGIAPAQDGPSVPVNIVAASAVAPAILLKVFIGSTFLFDVSCWFFPL